MFYTGIRAPTDGTAVVRVSGRMYYSTGRIPPVKRFNHASDSEDETGDVIACTEVVHDLHQQLRAVVFTPHAPSDDQLRELTLTRLGAKTLRVRVSMHVCITSYLLAYKFQIDHHR